MVRVDSNRGGAVTVCGTVADNSVVTDLDITKHTKALDEIATEGLAAIESAYEDAMTRIASLAGDSASPFAQVDDQKGDGVLTTEVAVVQAA